MTKKSHPPRKPKARKPKAEKPPLKWEADRAPLARVKYHNEPIPEIIQKPGRDTRIPHLHPYRLHSLTLARGQVLTLLEEKLLLPKAYTDADREALTRFDVAVYIHVLDILLHHQDHKTYLDVNLAKDRLWAAIKCFYYRGTCDIYLILPTRHKHWCVVRPACKLAVSREPERQCWEPSSCQECRTVDADRPVYEYRRVKGKKGQRPYLALHHIDRNDEVRSKPSFIQYLKTHLGGKKRPDKEAQDKGASLKGKRTEWICVDRQDVWEGDNLEPSKKMVKVNLYLIIPSFSYTTLVKLCKHKKDDPEIPLNMFHWGPERSKSEEPIDGPRLLVTNTKFNKSDKHNYDLNYVTKL